MGQLRTAVAALGAGLRVADRRCSSSSTSSPSASIGDALLHRLLRQRSTRRPARLRARVGRPPADPARRRARGPARFLHDGRLVAAVRRRPCTRDAHGIAACSSRATTLILYSDGLVERRGESDRRRASSSSAGAAHSARAASRVDELCARRSSAELARRPTRSRTTWSCSPSAPSARLRRGCRVRRRAAASCRRCSGSGGSRRTARSARSPRSITSWRAGANAGPAPVSRLIRR